MVARRSRRAERPRMTTTLRFELPWGRFHANPWGRSVNEGAIEWPPSPWRILRALYSAWKAHMPEIPEERVHPILEALASAPTYHLPPFSIAHTRHYLPGTGHAPGRKTETVKTLDPFVATERGAALLVRWDVVLNDEQRTLLAELVEHLGYLGRAESLIIGTVVDGDGPPEGWIADTENADGELIRLLAPTGRLDLAALTSSPLAIRKARQLTPPSTRFVTYPKPHSGDDKQPTRDLVRPRVAAVRFAVTGRPLPPRFAAVAIGHTARAAMMSSYGRSNDNDVSGILGGKDRDGSPLGGMHGHAHYLAFGRQGLASKVIDTLVVWAPAGLGEAELAAVARPFGLRAPEHVDGVDGRHLGVEAFGEITEVAPELCGPSRQWLSATPYAMVRHHKGSLEEQLRRDVAAECRHRGLPEPSDVEIVEGNWLSFRRHRPTERLAQARRSFGVALGFDVPVSGPLALGQLSHFGLGLFRPSE
jgi:CRISPR-associated protein Csb2